MMTLPAYFSLARRPRSLVNVSGIGGTGDGIDFARVGGVLGLVSGVLGFVIGIVLIVNGMIEVVGGVLGVVSSGLLGIVAGGVLGVVLGGAVGTSIFLRDWNFRGPFSALIMRAAGHDAGPVASSLTATASWRIMRVAAGLMPRAAGRRWLAEAESYLSEAPAEHRCRAARNYLLTAPQVIAVTWASALTRRTRPTGSEPTDRQSNASGDRGNF